MERRFIEDGKQIVKEPISIPSPVCIPVNEDGVHSNILSGKHQLTP